MCASERGVGAKRYGRFPDRSVLGGAERSALFSGWRGQMCMDAMYIGLRNSPNSFINQGGEACGIYSD